MRIFSIIDVDDSAVTGWCQGVEREGLLASIDMATRDLSPKEDSRQRHLQFLRSAFLSQAEWPDGLHRLDGPDFQAIAMALGTVCFPVPTLLVQSVQAMQQVQIGGGSFPPVCREHAAPLDGWKIVFEATQLTITGTCPCGHEVTQRKTSQT